MCQFPDSLNAYNQILTRYWGFTDFKPMQEEIIMSVASGRDTLALMPTGGGKSLTFQIPAMASEGICIVVTPLIALMKDQVENLVSKGIAAQAIFSGLSRNEIDVALDNCVYGSIKFLYVSPERLGTAIFRARVGKMKVNLIAVDEAHCISQWGYDFRPSYLKIAELRDIIPHVPVLALTATATKDVIEDIQERLKFSSPNVIRASFERRNLHYLVDTTDDKHRRLLEIGGKIPGSGIIYTRNRRRTVELARFLSSNGISADFYHAGLGSETRSLKQNEWMKGKIRIIVATNAFGMGIDKADVRFVMHFDVPDTLEAYFQEAGRAGRDSRISFAIMLYNGNDRMSADKRVLVRFPSIEAVRQVYHALGSYFRIPYGEGKGLVLDFNIADFSSRYGFSPTNCYYCLKTLENEGYLELTEEVNSPPRVHFTVGRDELYKFQVANASFDAFIKLLLRTYSGVFTGFVAIDEEFLAKRSRTTREVIYQYLVRLNKMKIVNYIPGRKSPLIIMNTERLDGSSLYLSASSLNLRKKKYVSRLNAVYEYISSNKICRSKFLLEYFGEQDAGICGNCDICRHKREAGLSRYEFDLISGNIREAVKNGNVRADELVTLLEYPPEKTLLVIRWLFDNAVLVTQPGNIVKWDDK